MLRYVPADLLPGAPLVVVLHGCTQTAGAFDEGTGWSRLAERHRFALLFPEQRRANNRATCFNWFEPQDTTRGSGEVASIRAMVAKMQDELQSDPARIFATGLSAGAAMTAALLATYPDVFSAGAIIAGLPYRSASSTNEAFGAMYHCPNLPERQWGDLVRNASPMPQRKPVVSVWHGDADHTVTPSAATEQVRQWCDVHQVGEQMPVADTVDGAVHRAWRDDKGVALVESYVVPGLGHGVPITPHAPGDHGVGHAGPFILESSISSTWHIARSGGLVPGEVSAPQRAPTHSHPPTAEMITRTLKTALGL